MITAGILIGHYLGDFLLQPRSWADKKHEDSKALIKHISVYTAVITASLWFALRLSGDILPLSLIIWWGLLNGIAHLIIDYFTSRAFHRNWPKNKALAINIFGLDQLAHLMCLFGTLGTMP